MWSIFDENPAEQNWLFSLYAGINVFVSEISVNNVSLGELYTALKFGIFQ